MLKRVHVNFKSVFFLAHIGTHLTCSWEGCPIPTGAYFHFCGEHRRKRMEQRLREIDRQFTQLANRRVCVCPENGCNGDGWTGRVQHQPFPNTSVAVHCPCDGHSEYVEGCPKPAGDCKAERMRF